MGLSINIDTQPPGVRHLFVPAVWAPVRLRRGENALRCRGRCYRRRGPFGFAQGRLFDSALSLALPNDKVPLRMTGLKRVPISQCADSGVTGKAHCAISVVSHSCAKDAQEWGTLGAGCAGG